MKKLSAIFFIFIFAVVLAGCRRDDDVVSFKTTYSGHYDTLNYLITQSASDSQVFANMVDGLVENDQWGNIVPSLATEWSYETEGDVQTWTFKIREGVTWQTNDGDVYEHNGETAYVTAHDWVASAKYILNPNNNSELTALLFIFIDGAVEYYESLANDNPDDDLSFEETVGVKAVDDYTLQYRLSKPAPWFITALTYNSFYPVYEPYLLDEGTSFGRDGDHILVNGAYFITTDNRNQRIELTKNPEYWDSDKVYIERVTMYFSGQQSGYDWARNLFESGDLDSFRVREQDTEGWKKYVLGDDQTGSLANPADPRAYVGYTVSPFTFFMQWNFNRTSFEGTTKNQQQIDDAKLAILNDNFRKGFLWGIDRSRYMAYYTGAERAEQWLRNIYTPGELGVDKDGKDYIEYVFDIFAERHDMQPELAYEQLSDSNDGRYDIERARQYFEQAKSDLKGLVSFPIVIETVGTYNPNELPLFQGTLQEFNKNFGDIVQFEMIVPRNSDEWNFISNQEKSYDIRWYMGWGPDYQDPYTYLHTFIVQDGEMLAYSGLGGLSKDDPKYAEDLALQQQLFGEYTRLVEEAAEIWEEDRLPERYRGFAEAEYHLIFEKALIIPFFSQNGEDIYVSRIKPFTQMKASYGLSDAKFKGMIILDEPITREEREKLKEEYEKSNPALQNQNQ